MNPNWLYALVSNIFLAVQAHVPTLSLSYAGKAWNFMNENGLGEWVIPVEEVYPDILGNAGIFSGGR